MRKTINYFTKLKQQGEKFTCLTAYDASFAQLMESSGIECLLIGDSLGMVIKGQESTLSVTLDEIIYHTQNVRRATKHCYIMADLPFGLIGSIEQTYQAAASLMSAGAQIIKIEGGAIMQKTVEVLTSRGIPVCSHLGLLPQSVHKIGGYKVQGKDNKAAQQILADAQIMVAAGADMLLLECVPSDLSQQLTKQSTIPVIGIGAGNSCDAQVLVSYDMLGITPGGGPSFSHNFLAENDSIEAAFKAYIKAVKSLRFPSL